MTATRLRLALICVIALMIIGFSAGGWWLQQQLSAQVVAADHARIDASVSDTQLSQLKRLKVQLASQNDIVNRAAQIAASAQQYKYQDQVINDLSGYAARDGVQISTFDFSQTAAAKKSTVAGAAKTPFTVSLKGPLPYITFLRFLQDIETNLTKMQVTSLTLAPDKNPANITNPTLSLEVYIKN